MADFHYVYILASEPAPGRPCVGVTREFSKRLAAHNAGKSPHTAKHRPWRIRAAIALPDRGKALVLEHYLKSHSGRAFTSKHL
jgi:predicted GIY-YIG superfamily endonuclease